MSKTKWYAKPIYVLSALALVLSLGIVALPMAGTVEASPDEWYVDDSVSASGDGKSWGTAFKTITEGITAAGSGDTINVAAGTYNSTSTIVINKDNLVLQGPQADVDPRPSYGSTRTAGSPSEAVIDGGSALKNIIRILADDVVINGLEIRSGTGDLIFSGGLSVARNIYRPSVKYNIIHDSSKDEGVQLKGAVYGVYEYNHVFDTGGDGLNFAEDGDKQTQYCVIRHNEIHDIGWYTGLGVGPSHGGIFVYNDGYGDLNVEIRENLIYHINTAGIKFGDYDWAARGGEIIDNIIRDTTGVGVRVRASYTTIEGNVISQTGGITVESKVAQADTVLIQFNSIQGNTFGVRNTAAATVDATYNWWGSVDGPEHDGNTFNVKSQGDKVSDNVDYVPWLDAAHPDGDPFAPVTSEDGDFSSIQAAINAATGTTINVAAGTYNERVNINKSLTLEGANAGIPATEVRGPESIINPQGLGLDFGVLIDGAGTTATIDGFTVENYKRAGILAGAFSLENDPAVVHILNNIVTEPIGQQNNNCIQVGDGTTGTIIGNEVSGANLESPDWSGSGILVAGSSDVLVSDNYVHNSEGGIQILGYAEYRGGAAAENNLIENNLVEGNGCGISVQGNSIGTIIRYNDVLNNDTGIGSLAYDFSYEQSTPSGTEIHYNNIVGNENYGVASSVWWHHTGDVLAEEVDAKYNWWGDETGPSHDLNLGGQGDTVSDNVNFSPWLYETQEKFVSGAPCYAGSVVLDNPATEVEPGSYAGGWNTFSTPILLDSSADTWGEVDNNLPAGYVALRFDSVAQKWETIALNYEIKPGEGFFIQISSKSSLPILCSTVLLPPQSRDLSSDWNLVGAPSYESKVVEDGLVSLHPTYTVVSSPGANPANWSYPPPDSKKLLPGRAYWVAMSAGKTLMCFEDTPVPDAMTWELNQPD